MFQKSARGRHAVYFLRDEESGRVVYVGISVRPKVRMYEHAVKKDTKATAGLPPFHMQVIFEGLSERTAKNVEGRLLMFHKQINPHFADVRARFRVSTHNYPTGS